MKHINSYQLNNLIEDIKDVLLEVGDDGFTLKCLSEHINDSVLFETYFFKQSSYDEHIRILDNLYAKGFSFEEVSEVLIRIEDLFKIYNLDVSLLIIGSDTEFEFLINDCSLNNHDVGIVEEKDSQEYNIKVLYKSHLIYRSKVPKGSINLNRLSFINIQLRDKNW